MLNTLSASREKLSRKLANASAVSFLSASSGCLKWRKTAISEARRRHSERIRESNEAIVGKLVLIKHEFQ
jgi:hypothetical protein